MNSDTGFESAEIAGTSLTTLTLADGDKTSKRLWSTMNNIQNRDEFEDLFKKDMRWGTLRETIRIAIQLYSTRFLIGPLHITNSSGHNFQVKCKSCPEFDLKFYLRSDSFWYVSSFANHSPSCQPLPPGKYFMKPRELALLIRTEFPNEISSQPSSLVPFLHRLGLFPHSFSSPQVHAMTSAMLKSLHSSMEPLISLTLPVLSGSRSRTRAAVTPFHHVLQGLTTFREDFLKHDPDNRLFIETAADGTYKRSTIIFGPVARLSRINSTGQYDLDGTYFKAQKHKKDRPTRLPGPSKG